ncbi:MAG: hypothetical protein K2G55_02755 [Lachnospiraceae bacterium]|nr:hypothetical protein [Lachnospiraceae bacterium]MDE7202593.1 hypothetical protein [Lachnospiraceae bacterium]
MEEINIPIEDATEKKQMSYSDRRYLGLESKPEDDEIIREIIQLFAKNGVTVDRAYKILKDTQTLLPRFAKLPYLEDSK